MNAKKYRLENYKKYLLNRVTSTPDLVEYIENCISSEDEAAKHTFHKIMVHNWTDTDEKLYNELVEYFTANFIPVDSTTNQSIRSFYTSNLNLIMRIINLDFFFPYQRIMYNLDVMFNDKTSDDCFDNHITIDDVVAGVVSNRMSDTFELNLSNFSADPEFIQKKIHFYKVNLLSNFKILMLRLGRDAVSLNLSNNNLSSVPHEILNFFMRGNLIEVNLSNNNLGSLNLLTRMGSKIEKLWLEGNPLCDDELDELSYVKQVMVKFPRLTELDGVKLNEMPFLLPFQKNFIDNPDKKKKMLVEKFLTLYFAHYDSNNRKSIDQFYDTHAILTIATTFSDFDEQAMLHYALHSRNILHPVKKRFVEDKHRLYKNRHIIVEVLTQLPPTLHDPSSFTVDVLKVENKSLMLIVEGVFIEKNTFSQNLPERVLSFRRTFIFTTRLLSNGSTMYFIKHEMYSIGHATNEQKINSFKVVRRIFQPLPEPEDTSCVFIQGPEPLVSHKEKDADVAEHRNKNQRKRMKRRRQPKHKTTQNSSATAIYIKTRNKIKLLRSNLRVQLDKVITPTKAPYQNSTKLPNNIEFEKVNHPECSWDYATQELAISAQIIKNQTKTQNDVAVPLQSVESVQTLKVLTPQTINKTCLTYQAISNKYSKDISTTKPKNARHPGNITDFAVAVTAVQTDYINFKHAKIVQEIVDQKIINLSTSMTLSFRPLFVRNPEISDGCLKYYCANIETIGWLKSVIYNLQTTEIDKLIVKRLVDVPRRVVCGLFAPGNRDLNEIKQIIQFQNPHVKVKGWALLKAKTNKNQTFISFFAPRAEAESIFSKDRRLNFLAGTVYVKFRSKNGQFMTTLPELDMATNFENKMDCQLNSSCKSTDDYDENIICISDDDDSTSTNGFKEGEYCGTSNRCVVLGRNWCEEEQDKLNLEKNGKETLSTELTCKKPKVTSRRLKLHNWDIKAALAEFMQDMASNKVTLESFDDDDFSDHSSLIDDID